MGKASGVLSPSMVAPDPLSASEIYQDELVTGYGGDSGTLNDISPSLCSVRRSSELIMKWDPKRPVFDSPPAILGKQRGSRSKQRERGCMIGRWKSGKKKKVR